VNRNHGKTIRRLTGRVESLALRQTVVGEIQRREYRVVLLFCTAGTVITIPYAILILREVDEVACGCLGRHALLLQKRPILDETGDCACIKANPSIIISSG